MYKQFAQFYDSFMEDAPYAAWRSFFAKTCKRYNVQVTRVADIGAGTGALANLLAEDGLHVIAVDNSLEMLAIASQKAQGQPRMRFLQMDMVELRLAEPVDALMAFCDTLNYLRNVPELKVTFNHFYENLVPGGLLLFDVHTARHAREIAKQEVLYEIKNNQSYIWIGNFDEESRKLEYDVTFFVEDESVSAGLYRRFDEWHEQTIFTPEEIREALLEAGFEDIQWTVDFQDHLQNIEHLTTTVIEEYQADRLLLVARRPFHDRGQVR